MSATGRTHQLLVAAITLVAIACQGCGRDDPEELAYCASAEWNAGRPAAAAAALARLARARRLTISERLLLSRTASEQGQLDEAIAALDDPHLPTKGHDGALIASRRGELEIERRRFRAAESELTRALALDPDCIDARRRLIWLYVQQGRSAEIITQSRALAARSKLEFLDLAVWTLARHEPFDLADLVSVLARAVEQDPGDRPSRLALAECQRRLGRLDQADSMLATLSATDAEACAGRARVALDRGDASRAQALLDKTTERDDHPGLAQLRGRLALAREDAVAAVHHFRAAIAAAPDDRDAQFGLAAALRVASKFEDARPYADAARTQDRLEWLVQTARSSQRRNDPGTLKAIAGVCLTLGRRELARAWYRLALDVAPEDFELRGVLSKLDSALGRGPHPQGIPGGLLEK